MAKQSVLCPHCGKLTEYDPEKEQAFCQECGQEMDMSGLTGIEEAAEKAYAAGDFLTAYDAYGKVLKTAPGDYRALFRRGLCTGHLSVGRELRLTEVLDGFEDAKAALAKQRNSGLLRKDHAELELASMEKDLMSFAIGTYRTLERTKEKQVFSNKEEAEKFASSARECVRLLDAIDDVATQEEDKKKLYTARIEACDLGLRASKLRYESPSTDKNGEPTVTIVTLKATKEYVGFMQQKRQNAVNAYNALPSIQAQAAELKENIAAEKEVISDYKAKRKQFLKASPETAKKLNGVTAIIVAAGIVLAAVFGVLAWFLDMEWHNWLWIGTAACLLLTLLIVPIWRSSYEKKAFSEELLRSKRAFKKSRKALKENKDAEAEFKAKTLKK